MKYLKSNVLTLPNKSPLKSYPKRIRNTHPISSINDMSQVDAFNIHGE